MRHYAEVGWNQLLHHTVNTLPTRWIKTHHIIAPSTTPHRLNDFNTQDFNHYQFLTYVYITRQFLTEITVTFNCYGVTTTQLSEYVNLYFCDDNVTRKMVSVAAETCWLEIGE